MTESEPGAPRRSLMRRLYDWVIGFADTRYAVLALFLLAFAESSFFPIPPDVLLLALCFGAPKKSLKYALVCAVGSVLGGIGGYYIGYAFEDLGRWLISTLAGPDKFDVVAGMYGEDAFFYVTLAAFTPIPYKVFTIAGGMFHETVPLMTLVGASALGRTARFLLVAGAVWKFGPAIKPRLERYFDRIMWIFLLLIVLGFASIKMMKSHKPLTLKESIEKLDSENANDRYFRNQAIEKAAGKTFGFDPDQPFSDPANAAAAQAIRAWFAERDAAKDQGK